MVAAILASVEEHLAIIEALKTRDTRAVVAAVEAHLEASLRPAPLDFIARLAALVSKPRVNLTRFARIVLILARFAGPPKRSKYVPDAFFTAYSPPTADSDNK